MREGWREEPRGEAEGRTRDPRAGCCFVAVALSGAAEPSPLANPAMMPQHGGMIIMTLMLAGLLAAERSVEDRLAILQDQFAGLERIAVAPGEGDAAAEKLRDISDRLAKGVESPEEVDVLYRRMDEVRSWLLDHAAERPAPGGGTFTDTPVHWAVQGQHLKLRLGKEDLAMEVTTPGGTWRWAPAANDDVTLRDGSTFGLLAARRRDAEAFNTGFSTGMRLSLADFPAAPDVRIDLLFHLIGMELVVEVVGVSDLAGLDTLAFPKEVITAATAGDIAVIPRMQGMLIPGDWPREIKYRELTQSRALYMPWWGHIAGGRGVQLIYETADDAGVDYHHPTGGPTHVRPLWYASMTRLRYPRLARYVFDDEATYVRMARRYRRFVQERGEFASLAQKRLEVPNLDEVIGRPVAHVGALYHRVEGSRYFRDTRMESNHLLATFAQVATTLRQMKANGVDDAYVHLDGWGYRGYDNSHPDVLPPGPEQGGWEGLRLFADTCDELGYLFAVHDQYRDFYFNAASFDDKLAIRNADGTRTEHAEWNGGMQTFLSPRFAPDYVRRNHDLFAEHGIKVRGAYLDVFGVVPLEESYQPSHPVTRTDCARYRRECFDLLRARGYVVSTEEPTDYVLRAVHLVHHGPYSAGVKGYGQGEGIGIAVPLFNLVYHDAILLPWAMGDDGGWGIPDGDAGWLHCILNAGLPYVGPGASPEQIARVREACAVAARLGLADMVDHEFLDDARRIRRTTFSDGTRITGDFDRKSYKIEWGGSG